jgi:hypothetical protein
VIDIVLVLTSFDCLIPKTGGHLFLHLLTPLIAWLFSFLGTSVLEGIGINLIILVVVLSYDFLICGFLLFWFASLLGGIVLRGCRNIDINELFLWM